MSIMLALHRRLREIFMARLNDLVGFLQRPDGLKFIANVLHKSGTGEPIRIDASLSPRPLAFFLLGRMDGDAQNP